MLITKHGVCMAMATIVLVATGLSCSKDGPIGTRTPPVDVELVLLESDIFVGDWVGLEIRLTNRTGEPIELLFEEECDWVIEVVRDGGERVVRRWGNCHSQPRTLTLPVGVVVLMPAGISTLSSDMPDADWFLSTDRMPPGRYRIRGGLTAHTHLAHWAEGRFTVSEWQRPWH